MLQYADDGTQVVDESKPEEPEKGKQFSFSKASFVSDLAGEVDIDDPQFWTKTVGLRVQEVMPSS